MQHMGEAVAPWQGVTLLDVAFQEGDRGMSAEFWVFGKELLWIAAEYGNL